MNVTKSISFLEEAITLGDKIARRGDSVLDPLKSDRKQHASASLANGVSGVTLFLIELYRQTQDPRYISLANQAVKNLVRFVNTQPAADYSFAHGRMGVAYTLLQFYKVSLNAVCLDEAKKIAQKSAEQYLNNPGTFNTFHKGRAGSLLVLLHLHALTDEKWVLDLINLYVNKLMRDVRHGRQGLYWKSAQVNAHSECGFPLGASGIGYVLLELGRYFENDTFYTFAEQVFFFEDYYRSEERNNWPNQSAETRNAEDYFIQRENFKTGNFEAFRQSEDLVSYNGAAGIGLARSRAYELLGKTRYRTDMDNVFDKVSTTMSDLPAYGLYDGKIGCGMFALEAYRITKDVKYLQFAKRTARELSYGVDYSTQVEGREDFSLYHGMSGVGYFYMMLQNPFDTTSLVLPGLEFPIGDAHETSAMPFIGMSRVELAKRLLGKIFYRTIFMLENLAPAAWREFLNVAIGEADIKNRFMMFAEAVIPTLDEKYIQAISDIFNLERAKVRLEDNMISESFVQMNEIMALEKAEALVGQPDGLCEDVWLSLADNIVQVQTSINPNMKVDLGFSENVFKSDRQHTVLLKATSRVSMVKDIRQTTLEFKTRRNDAHVQEIYPNKVQSLLLSRLNESCQVKTLMNDISKICHVALTSEDAMTPAAVLRQIKDDLIAGILVANPTASV
ncbi:lanthionine synthetase LanC family protein [Chryseolinea lacunae]|uniref:Lanthionine synthetase C-like protein n=1 Tax=Chryseolinea lacunae TaxID=2801331 RepID=A0ABS1KQ02_9BACT|nr:lanthionine synthetase LanC family protein [Chryseolinea lacunae]MBL0741383.1 hypothetical protein [Chryseolinea lacunae]